MPGLLIHGGPSHDAPPPHPRHPVFVLALHQCEIPSSPPLSARTITSSSASISVGRAGSVRPILLKQFFPYPRAVLCNRTLVPTSLPGPLERVGRKNSQCNRNEGREEGEPQSSDNFIECRVTSRMHRGITKESALGQMSNLFSGLFFRKAKNSMQRKRRTKMQRGLNVCGP